MKRKSNRQQQASNVLLYSNILYRVWREEIPDKKKHCFSSPLSLTVAFHRIRQPIIISILQGNVHTCANKKTRHIVSTCARTTGEEEEDGGLEREREREREAASFFIEYSIFSDINKRLEVDTEYNPLGKFLEKKTRANFKMKSLGI